VKLKTEPVAKRKPNLCPTRCIPPSTVAYLEKESSLEPVTPQYATIALGRGKLVFGEWPPMRGFEDKQALSALNVSSMGIRDRLKVERPMATEPPQ
jgi:hypothetical protein